MLWPGFSGFIRWRRGLASLALAAISSVSVSSLNGATNIFPRYNVRVWQIDDGLPQNSVWAITQSNDGYLWVGTQQGLARFDGMRFVTLESKSAPELKRGYISALCTGSDASLWIGCSGSGLFRMHDGQFSRFSEADGLPTNHLNCILEASDGTLWIGTDYGLTRYRDGKFTTLGDKQGIVAVKALYEDKRGVVRAATSRGLVAVGNDGAISTLNFGGGTTANILKSVCEDDEGNIWVASNEGITSAHEQQKTV